MRAIIAKRARNQNPLVTESTDSSIIGTHPQNADDQELRNFQVQEIARYYGIPLPLLSVSIRQWGAAVNEQISKLGYRWGVKLHLDRILAPLRLKLLMPGERFRIDPTELVRGDTEGDEGNCLWRCKAMIRDLRLPTCTNCVTSRACRKTVMNDL